MHETSAQPRYPIPMAISLAYGVAYGTVIALVVVPALYLLVEDAGDAVSWVGRRLRR